jgi:hypothetical protein
VSCPDRQAEIGCGKKGFDRIPGAFDRFAAAFLPVDHCHHAEDIPAFTFDGGDGVESRTDPW